MVHDLAAYDFRGLSENIVGHDISFIHSVCGEIVDVDLSLEIIHGIGLVDRYAV